MAEYTVHYNGRHALTDVDAHALRLQVRRDHSNLQAVEILVSGHDLDNRWGITCDHRRFWPAVATVGLRALRTAIQREIIPTTTPAKPWLLYINRSDVDRIIGSHAELPTLVEHAEIARFNL
jgi:hypothetical protein